ncbi:TPA: VCBS repeat-containing protein [Candidatus Poribacteria bacterium]|nr:VCBS repeat-containing protein [Candidatus Poribacteria bacterium]
MAFAFGAIFGDYDNDGDLDLFVANDAIPNFLYRNNSDGRFAEMAIERRENNAQIVLTVVGWDAVQ